MKVIGVIPARYASSRFPGKPLAMIGGKTMIEHVYRGCRECTKLSDLLVATDDDRIFRVVEDFGGKAVMTDIHHPNGTSRIIEIMYDYDADKKIDWVINIQGDEPLIKPHLLDQLISVIESKPKAEIITMVRKMDHPAEAINPNIVKCVFTQEHKALYFSRSPIPYHRDKTDETYFQHLGLYAYKKSILSKIQSLIESKTEKAELLEQLRWLENDLEIFIGITDYVAHSVDSPEDLEKVTRLMGFT